MTTAASFEGIRYVRSDLFNTTALTPLRETHHKGGILGTVLGVVAAIVVPFVAPMIAGTLFAGSTLLSGTVGSALVGSALGAGASALTGGNPLTGALVGGLGGGLAGFSQTGSLFGGTAPAPSGAVGSALTSAQTAASSPTATGVIGAAAEASGLPVSSTAAADLASGLSGSLNAAAPPPSAPSQSISQTLSNATGNIVSADTIGKVGSGLMGAGVQAIPGMLAAQEASAASAAQADLANAQANVFKNQLAIAEELKQGAMQVDPQYLGQRAQAGVFKNLAAQQREMAGQEAIRGGESQAAFDAAELRRGQIYGTEAAITAGDNARLAGLSTQNQMLRGASAAYPTPPSGYANYLERAAGSAAKGYGNIAGAFAYPFITDYMKNFYNTQKTS